MGKSVPSTGKCHWVFVCNPKVWNVARFLALKPEHDSSTISPAALSWGVRKRDRDLFAPGQLGILRVGDRRTLAERNGEPKLATGIYALCEVESKVVKEGEYDEFWIGPKLKRPGWLIVRLRYLKTYLDNPLTIDRLQTEKHVHLKVHRGDPSFPIPAEDFRAVMNLLGEKLDNLAEPTRGEFQFKSGCTVKPSSTTASLAERQLNITLRHNEIQRALHDHLATLYGAEDVGTELNSAGGQVDVVVRRGEKYRFYEIKTSRSARDCIQEALAQLLEYSYWPGGREAEKLIIVGEAALDSKSKSYITTLRDKFSLPIEYQQFDVKSGTIVGYQVQKAPDARWGAKSKAFQTTSSLL